MWSKIAIGLVLGLAGFLIISQAVIALSPYIAITIILVGLAYYLFSEDED